MNTLYTAFVLGGLGMYPILITGIILIVASIRYAIDGEPIRLRFILATVLAMLTMMSFWTICDIVVMLKGMYTSGWTSEPARTAMAHGISAVINQWGLGLLDMTIASISVAVGAYRVGYRQLRALRP
jgi:hypothetical protein